MVWQLKRPMAQVVPAAGALGVRAQQEVIKSAFAAPRQYPHDFLLLLRFGLVNLVALALIAAAYMQGWIDIIRAGDPTHQCTAIVGVFIVGLAMCTQRIWRVSRELNEVRSERPSPSSRVGQYLTLVRSCGPESRSLIAGSLRTKLVSRSAVVRHIANTLVILGLIGTVIGFIIALSGVKPEAATDVKVVAPMISTLILGMSVALYTTLVGAVLNIWLMVNYHMLASGTVSLYTALLERGEADVG